MNNFYLYLCREPKFDLAKKLKIAIWILCSVVFVLVGLMRMPQKLDIGIDFSFLPPVHAALNSAVTVLLLLALVAIKKKNIALHVRSINLAMLISIAFLLCYVAYHFTTKETLYSDFNGDGEVSAAEKIQSGHWRSFYFFVLITHIVVAGISLPFICYTWMLGVTNQFSKHKKMAKWIFPMWLYVAATGPVCYFLLKPFY